MPRGEEKRKEKESKRPTAVSKNIPRNITRRWGRAKGSYPQQPLEHFPCLMAVKTPLAANDNQKPNSFGMKMSSLCFSQ